MAKVELSEETKAGIEEVREADLLIAVAVPVDTEQLRAAATQAILGTGQSISGLRTVVTFPGSRRRGSPHSGEDGRRIRGNARIALRPLRVARRQSREDTLAPGCQHLSGAVCHGPRIGSERLRRHRIRSSRIADKFSGSHDDARSSKKAANWSCPSTRWESSTAC